MVAALRFSSILRYGIACVCVCVCVDYVSARFCKGCRQKLDITLFRYDNPDLCNEDVYAKQTIRRICVAQGLLAPSCVLHVCLCVLFALFVDCQAKSSGSMRPSLMRTERSMLSGLTKHIASLCLRGRRRTGSSRLPTSNKFSTRKI